MRLILVIIDFAIMIVFVTGCFLYEICTDRGSTRGK